MKSESPYRKEFLLLSGSTVELLHTSGLFDGWGYDVAFTVLSDEHEGVFEGTRRGPDYVQGQLLSIPHGRVQVGLTWKCKPLPDGRERHMFDHHLHHFPWNHPHLDVMEHYRAVALLYRVEVTVQPKAVQLLQPTSERSAFASSGRSRNPLSPHPVSPNPNSPSPSPSPHTMSRPLGSLLGSAASPRFTSPSALQPTMSLRWSAYTWFWHLVAMFQDPPLYLSPLEKRTSPSLGELFTSCSLSVLCVQPKVELLHEDERAPGRLNVLLLCAERFGVDWMWIAHWDDKGRKSYESQDMACDANQLYARAMVPETPHQQHEDDDRAQSERAKQRPRTEAQEKAELHRRLLTAALYQQQKREEGEVVNFNDPHGQYCSPFEHQPLDYHSEYFLATRLFAYRTHYPAPSSSGSASPSSYPSPTASAPPQSQARGSVPAGAPDQPPFSMPMQGSGDGSEWTALFGELMGSSDTPDEVDVIWEGRGWSDEAVELTPSSRRSGSGEGRFPDGSMNEEAGGEDEDDLFIRRHTLSLSGSDDGSLVDDDRIPPSRQSAVGGRLITTRRRATTQRPHSDGSIRYMQLQHGQLHQPASLPRSHDYAELDSLHSASPASAFPRIDVGATRGRAVPAQYERDWSSCSHRMIAINLKLLWSNHIKHSVQQWMDVFSRPYEPPVFVRASQAAYAEWKRTTGDIAAVVEEKADALNVSQEMSVADSEVAAAFDLSRSAAYLNQSVDSTLLPVVPAGAGLGDGSRPSSPSSSGQSSDSDAEHAAFDMMALVRGSEDSPLNTSASSVLPSPVASLPASRKSSMDGPESARSYMRTLLRAYDGRRADSDTWLSLFGVDLVRPQINFQSRDTNSRLVLAASRARVDSEGLPIHVHRISESTATRSASVTSGVGGGAATAGRRSGSLSGALSDDELVLTGLHQLESYVYYEKKHACTLTDAQAFVCPVDLEGAGRVQWVKDVDVMQRAAEDEKKQQSAAAAPSPSPAAAARRKSRGALMSFWGGDKAKDEPVTATLQKDLGGSGVLRKIVEPCTMHFAMTQQCNIEEELKARDLVVCDEVNGIVMSQTSYSALNRPPRPSALSLSSPRDVRAVALDKVRTLSQSIQLFLPAFSAHLDSNEYFTLLGVVQALFLSPTSSSSLATAEAEEEEEVKSPPSSKEELQSLMERLLDADHERRAALRGRRKKVHRVVQYYVGGSVWSLSQHGSAFIAAHVHGLHGAHTFFDDGSSDTEFAIHFLTLQSKLLAEGDPLANLLIPDPDRWVARDHKRDMMISARAKVHAPLLTDDARVKGVTVYEHFEVTVFPLILRFPHDHYVCIRAYFFPQLQDVSEEDKQKATQNFFQRPKRWRGAASSRTTTTTTAQQQQQQPGRAAEQSATRSQQQQQLISPTGRGSVVSRPGADSRGSRESSRPASPGSPPRLPLGAPVGLPRAVSSSAHSSPMSSPSFASSPPPLVSPRRGERHSALSHAPSKGSHSGSDSRPQPQPSSLMSTSSIAEPSSTTLPFIRPRVDSRALTFDLRRSHSGIPQPALHARGAAKASSSKAPSSSKDDKSKASSSSSSSSKGRRPVRVTSHYFRYVRINTLDLLASYHGESALTSLENVHLVIEPFIKNQRSWSWQKFYSKLEKHLLLMVLLQANHIIARKMGRKVEEGGGVHSLSQRFLDLFMAKDEEAEERRLLGFPKAVSPPQDDGEGKPGKFFRMPSMPTVHMPSMPSMPSMPQLSLGAVRGAGEELAQKATLLFGNKYVAQRTAEATQRCAFSTLCTTSRPPCCVRPPLRCRVLCGY